MTKQTTQQTTAQRRREEWQSRLIDLSRRNRLVYFSPKGTQHLAIVEPNAAAVFDRLVAQEKPWEFWMPRQDVTEVDEADVEATGIDSLAPELPLLPAIADPVVKRKASEVVCRGISGAALRRIELERIIKKLYRRSKADYQERGVRILFVTFGMLHWRESPTSDVVQSPLILCPVELERETAADPYVLSMSDEDLILNPALDAKLRKDFNVRLPDLPAEWDETPLSSYLANVADVVRPLGWSVESTTTLGLFSFSKLVMYQDLEANGEQIDAHPVIQALCGTGTMQPALDLPAENDLDRIQTPEQTFQILDADSSQQRCIQAALRGHNLVLQGPPGTGKSQTIANIIAECLARGKTVLFVSEKMAALEVVFNRLREVGLAHLCLEIHSHKVNKKEVVAELKRCLDEILIPKRLPAVSDFEALQRQRDQLNGYVTSLHQERAPLGMSAYEVLGALAQLAAYPVLPVTDLDIERLNSAYMRQAEELMHRLMRVWTVVEEGATFPWRGCREDHFSLEVRDRWIERLNHAGQALTSLETSAVAYSTTLDLPRPVTLDDVAWLLRVGHHLTQSPGPDRAWLTTPELPRLFGEAETFRALSADYWRLRGAIEDGYAEAVFDLPTGISTRLTSTWAAVQPLLARLDPDAADLLGRGRSLLAFLTRTRVLIAELQREGAVLASRFGCDGDVLSIERVRALARLATLCACETRPEAGWLQPLRWQEVQSLISRVRPVCEEYSQGRAALLERYEDSFFTVDSEQLLEKFTGFGYRSFLRWLHPGYRRTRSMIRRTTRTLTFPPSISDDLLQLRALGRLERQVDEARDDMSRLLGWYDKGLSTDFATVEQALSIAQKAIQWVGKSPMPDEAIDALAIGTAPDLAVAQRGGRLLGELSSWDEAGRQVGSLLPWDRLPGETQSLLQAPLDLVDQWAERLITSLDALCVTVETICACRRAADRPTLAGLTADMRQLDDMRATKAHITAEGERLEADFGAHYRAEGTQWETVLAMLQWTRAMRELMGNIPISEAFGAAVAAGGEQAPSIVGLKTAYDDATRTLAQVADGFDEHQAWPMPQHPEDRVRLAALAARIETLRARLDDLQTWTDFVALSATLRRAGLASFIAHAEQRQLPAADLVPILRKSLFQAWMQNVYSRDPVLSEFRGRDHEQIIRDFRRLDRHLVQSASYRVIAACNERRPRDVHLQAGDAEISILRREAAKRRRILPVRHLLDAIPNVALRLKPCLMMSPLSVSQFLHPQRLRFDVVIFDEASQIFTEDAVGAIYRGRQLIVAGDSKQLPPTNFFASLDGDDEDAEPAEAADISSADFNSVLDECAAVLPVAANLSLRWHYRSRHEQLIAFSNQQFYQQRLITFPAARHRDDALGVHFRYVPDGVYDRGRTRTNPREIAVVVDCIFGHFQRHPDKSLGVVAFSQAQMTGIEDALELRRKQHPEYEQFFNDDRLHGFFVKNLENVQGDERDVIIFSVGYGRDQHGRLSMNFGPLNKAGGERRLNVAITRAREKIIVVSSIRASDVDLQAVQAPGVLNLWRYLDYAERGEAALEIDHPQGMGETESPLEDDVRGVIRQLGYEVVPQVGCSGFRIDLGVVRPAEPGYFLLGVECDGATYHAAATARDRDRIRQHILERLGWRIHRIWSPDWAVKREQEIARLKAAIEAARAERSAVHLPAMPVSVELGETHSDRGAIERQPARQTDSRGGLPGTIPYVVAPIDISHWASRGEFHLPEHRRVQQAALVRLVEVEGPIHIEVATRRLATAWGIARAGSRVMDAVEEAAVNAQFARLIRRQGPFLWPSQRRDVPVRTPVDGIEESWRSIEHIAPEEIKAALLLVATHAIGIGVESLVTETARVFGFARTGGRIRQSIVEALASLKQSGHITQVDDTVSLSRHSG